MKKYSKNEYKSPIVGSEGSSKQLSFVGDINLGLTAKQTTY